MKPYKTLFILLVLMVLLYGPSLFREPRIGLPGGIDIDLPAYRDLPEPIPSLIGRLDTAKLVADPGAAITGRFTFG